MFHGAMVALVTPMQENGDVDYDSFSRLLDWQVESGTQAIVVLGTTGEASTVSHAERSKLIRTAATQLKGKAAVIAGTGANSTALTIEYTKMAMADGADAALIVTPYYNKPTQEGLYLHYKTVAEAVPIPQILYNVPGRTACDLLLETVIRLADIPNIVGLKDATADISRVQPTLAATDGKIDLFSGEDITALAFMRAGGKGVISVTANIAPAAMSEFCNACLAGDFTRAEALDAQLQPLHKSLFVESNPIPAKWALCEMGRIPAGIRLPLTTLANERQSEVRQALTQFGAL